MQVELGEQGSPSFQTVILIRKLGEAAQGQAACAWIS